MNETIKGDFLNYTSNYAPPYPFAAYIFNASTNFTYKNVTSNIRLEVWFHPYGGTTSYYELQGVEIPFEILIFGNISQELHVSNLSLTMSDAGQYNTSDVVGFLTMYSPPEYLHNVTETNFNAEAFGSFNLTGYYKVDRIVDPYGFTNFSTFSGLNDLTGIDLILLPHQINVGTHIIHIIASLNGLADPVTVTINLLLVDTSTCYLCP